VGGVGGDKFKTNEILTIVGARRLNKNCRNNNLVVRQLIGTPRFQVQKHHLRTIKNSGKFDPLGRALRTL